MIGRLHMSYSLDAETVSLDAKQFTQGRGIYFHHHRPETMHEPYHVHPSIEVNYLRNCSMTYSFSGTSVHVPAETFCIFWAVQPHRVIDVQDTGTITNAYISLQEFWDWSLPKHFVERVFQGCVLLAKADLATDEALMTRWASELDNRDRAMNRIHCLEAQARLARLAQEGWHEATTPRHQRTRQALGGKTLLHFERMMRFISANYTSDIGLRDVAESATVSPNYANTVFKKMLGTTVKAHLSEIRLTRARMLLTETDEPVINIALDSGFGSSSSFYEAFQSRVGTSPARFRKEHGRTT